MAFLDENGMLYFWQKIKDKLSKKVDVETGKGLSSNDYTTTEKEKLAAIANNANNYVLPTATAETLGGVKVGQNLNISGGVLNATDTTYTVATTSKTGLMSSTDKSKLDNVEDKADVNVIESVKVNGTALTVTDKAVNVEVPTNNNQLVNGAGYHTAAQVTTLIAQAGHLKRTIVTSLPTSNIDTNTVYMILKSSGSTGNIYDEYMYINSAWELIGNSTADLSQYVKNTDVIANSDIDTILAS